MSTAGIYLIIHTRTGKVYVGQSRNFSRRWKKHKQDLGLGQHHNHKLQKLWLEDGYNAFDFRATHYLPEDLSALESQRWLVRKEREVWEEYRTLGLELNIVRPEIVETTAAIDEYNLERKTKTKAITNEIEKLKPLIQTIQAAANAKSLDVEALRQQTDDTEALLKRNTGWRPIFFGRETKIPIEEIKKELHDKRTKLMAAEAEKQHLYDELQGLEQKKKALHRSYPGNVDRRIAKNATFSGKLRKPTIR